VFWVISVYFNIRNTLPKSGIFLLGHPVYTVYLLMMGYKYARNMQRLIDETNLRINSASSWFLLHRSAYCPGNISVTNE